MDPSVSIIMAAALVFYSIGVWGERIQGRLKWWHFVLDMVGGLTFDIHGISGLIAIILMFIHAVWALIVLLRKNEKMIQNFHKFSLFVWVVWLIPYFSPMFFNLAM